MGKRLWAKRLRVGAVKQATPGEKGQAVEKSRGFWGGLKGLFEVDGARVPDLIREGVGSKKGRGRFVPRGTALNREATPWMFHVEQLG
jgi:hypothetical protein